MAWGAVTDSGLEGSAMRIVSLTPAATEIVYALGLGGDLVGRTHACDYPAEAIEVPVVTVSDPDAPERSLDGALLAKLEEVARLQKRLQTRAEEDRGLWLVALARPGLLTPKASAK